MRDYDLFLILSGNLSEAEIPARIEEIKNFLVSIGAENVNFLNLGRQKLAYSLGQMRFGYLIDFVFSFWPEKVEDLKEKMKLEMGIARLMMTTRKAGGASITADILTETMERKRPAGKMEKKEKEISAPTEKKEADLTDINKKIDEILQQDNFVV